MKEKSDEDDEHEHRDHDESLGVMLLGWAPGLLLDHGRVVTVAQGTASLEVAKILQHGSSFESMILMERN